MNVKEGEIVQPGQLLAQIDDRQAQLQKEAAELERDAAQARADDDIDVRFAQVTRAGGGRIAAGHRHQSQVARFGAGKRGRRKQLAEHRAELQIDRSELDRRIAQMTANVQNAAVRSAEESIRRRRIEAPFAGMVIDIFREAAEWVNAGEPVLRVVRMDRLRVDGFLDGAQFNPTDAARRPVVIAIQLAQNRVEQFTGEVVFVSPLVQAGNKYRVSAEVQNREELGQPLLRPGMSATMLIR